MGTDSGLKSLAELRADIARQEAELAEKQWQAAELIAKRERLIDSALKNAGRNRVSAIEELVELFDIPAAPPRETRDKNGQLVLKKDGTPKVRFVDRDESNRMEKLVATIREMKSAAESTGAWPPPPTAAGDSHEPSASGGLSIESEEGESEPSRVTL